MNVIEGKDFPREIVQCFSLFTLGPEKLHFLTMVPNKEDKLVLVFSRNRPVDVFCGIIYSPIYVSGQLRLRTSFHSYLFSFRIK